MNIPAGTQANPEASGLKRLIVELGDVSATSSLWPEEPVRQLLPSRE
jgi:hypothetical protein